MARGLKKELQPSMRAVYDDTGGIGKLYARQDEIGTPFCVTVDHQSLEDEAVTVRDRDTWEQERVKVSELPEYLRKRLGIKC
jgi:glycyl-tRNA synthetase